jgi:hypothetical protein
MGRPSPCMACLVPERDIPETQSETTSTKSKTTTITKPATKPTCKTGTTSTACRYVMKCGGGATCIPCLDKHMICIKPNEHDPLPSTSSGTLRILLAHQTYLIPGAINQSTIKDETRPLRKLGLCVPSTWEQPSTASWRTKTLLTSKRQSRSPRAATVFNSFSHTPFCCNQRDIEQS